MAEYCEDCFIESLGAAGVKLHDLPLSEELRICGRCGKEKRYVLDLKDEPFCPFAPAYCDVSGAGSCVGCAILTYDRRTQ